MYQKKMREKLDEFTMVDEGSWDLDPPRMISFSFIFLLKAKKEGKRFEAPFSMKITEGVRLHCSQADQKDQPPPFSELAHFNVGPIHFKLGSIQVGFDSFLSWFGPFNFGFCINPNLLFGLDLGLLLIHILAHVSVHSSQHMLTTDSSGACWNI